MKPAELVALDDALRMVGQSITLRRRIGTGSTFVDVPCRAIVRGYDPRELVGGITQTDSKVILSPTDLDVPTWPGAAGGTLLPRKGDLAVIAGRSRNVEAASPFYVRDILVRIELRVLG